MDSDFPRLQLPAHRLGRAGEEIAARFLIACGYQLIERNWRGTGGEIDIIAVDNAIGGDEYVIVEVKTRSSRAFGDPFDAITPEKYRRLYRLGREWIAAHQPHARWRIDVILLVKSFPGFEIVHHKDVIA